jgi:voltage-gated potassium channel
MKVWPIQWIKRVVVFGTSVAASFYLFIVPIYAAAYPYEVGPWGIAFAAFLFVQLWLLIGSYVLTTAAAFYGFDEPIWFVRFRVLDGNVDTPRAAKGWRVILAMLLSYLFTVYAFGVAYIFLSALDKAAFSTESTLSFVDGLYFSVVTAATVGYGDIAPRSTPAKIAVMLEIAVSLLYVVFLFSIASSYAREIAERRK